MSDDTKKEKIIGIDLGTSNSAASVLIGGKPTVIPSAEGASQYGKAFPSYVAYTEDGQRLVGEPARRQAVTNPENTISAFKRSMGTDRKFSIQGKQYSPQEISAALLQKIKKDAESFLGILFLKQKKLFDGLIGVAHSCMNGCMIGAEHKGLRIGGNEAFDVGHGIRKIVGIPKGSNFLIHV